MPANKTYSALANNPICRRIYMEKLYKVDEVAKILQLSASFIYRKAEKGEIASIKIGTAVRISQENINEYIEKCKKAAKPMPCRTSGF